MKSLSKFLSLIGVLGGLFITILWFPLLVKLLGLSVAVDTFSYKLMWALSGWRYIIMDISIIGLLFLFLSGLCIWMIWKENIRLYMKITFLVITASIGLFFLYLLWIPPFILLGAAVFLLIFDYPRMAQAVTLFGGLSGILISIYWPILLPDDQTDLFQRMFFLGGWEHFVFPITVVEIGLLAATLLGLFILLKEERLAHFHYYFLIGTGILGMILLPYLWWPPLLLFLLAYLLVRKAIP
jgi:hypothetical protein